MRIPKKLLTLIVTMLLGTMFAFPALAETISGELEGIEDSSIVGWVWDKEDYDHIINVEIRIEDAASGQIVKTETVLADQYRDDLHESIGDGYHGFSTGDYVGPLTGSEYIVTAYAVTDEAETLLPGTFSFDKATDTVKAIDDETAVEISNEEDVEITGEDDLEDAVEDAAKEAIKASSYNEIYLGTYTVTGYCNCSICSGGSGLTYSGTVPKANHTISADLNVHPLGTKIRIGDIIYTVEDMGSSVKDNWIDIYFDNHEEAVAYGTKYKDAYLIVE